MTKKQEPKSRQPNNFIRLSGVGLQMGITIYLAAYFGGYLDEKYLTEKKWFTMAFVILAVVLSLYSLIKQLNKINEKDK